MSGQSTVNARLSAAPVVQTLRGQGPAVRRRLLQPSPLDTGRRNSRSGNNAFDVYAMFTEHRRAVEAVSRG